MVLRSLRGNNSQREMMEISHPTAIFKKNNFMLHLNLSTHLLMCFYNLTKLLPWFLWGVCTIPFFHWVLESNLGKKDFSLCSLSRSGIFSHGTRHLVGFLFGNFFINVLNICFVCLCQGNAKISCSVYLPWAVYGAVLFFCSPVINLCLAYLLLGLSKHFISAVKTAVPIKMYYYCDYSYLLCA